MHYYCDKFMWMTFLKSVLPKCYILKNIYLFLCLKVIFDILGSFWLKNNSNFGKVQFCPELSNFSRFYPILAAGEDFSTIVRLLYKPCFKLFNIRNVSIQNNCCEVFWLALQGKVVIPRKNQDITSWLLIMQISLFCDKVFKYLILESAG